MQDQIEQRRLDRLLDALPVFSGSISPDGYLSQTRPQTEATFLWELPEFAYAHDSVTQIIDLCETAASGRRVQVERPYLKAVSEHVEDYRQGLLTLTPLFDEHDNVEDIAMSLIDCEEAGFAPIDPFAKSRLVDANTRISSMLTLAQTVIEASHTSGQIDRDRLTRRLDVLASIIDTISRLDLTHIPVATLIGDVCSTLPETVRSKPLKTDLSDTDIPIQSAPLFCLLLSELFNNSWHHGAWRTLPPEPSGIITIKSQTLDTAFGRALHLSWEEEQGPPVPGLMDRGFGFTLADRLFPQMTGGTAKLHNSEHGISWSFILPLPQEKTDWSTGETS